MKPASTIEYVSALVYPAALAFLPEKMNTSEAKAMILAIGAQESDFAHRNQVGGPAEGFWQFESGGGWKGVVNHPATSALVREVLAIMSYGLPDLDDYYAIEHNDVLACVFARLLLWTHPLALPQRDNSTGAWDYYSDTWRPGKPHRDTWGGNFARAWQLVAP